MNKNIRLMLLTAACLLTATTAIAQRELHLYTHRYNDVTKLDSAMVEATFDASRIDSIKVMDHIDVAPAGVQAEVDGYRVRISWEPVPSVPFYRIFRSIDGENWKPIFSTMGSEYVAYDNEPPFGTVYYKVCVGSYSFLGPFSEVASVEVAPEIYAYTSIFKPMTAYSWHYKYRYYSERTGEYETAQKVIGDNHECFGFQSICLALDVMSEDIAFGAISFFGFDYQLDYRDEQYIKPANAWYFFYQIINQANECINLLKNDPSTDSEIWLLAQAYALRGMAYMYLVQIYSDYMSVGETEGELTPLNLKTKGVPILYTEYDGKNASEISAAHGRNTVGEVLDEVERNLKESLRLFGLNFPSVYNYTPLHLLRIGINYTEVWGLLARYYLLTQDWDSALTAAQNAVDGNINVHDLTDGFMDVYASDVMWGFDHTADTQTTFASFFSHMSNEAPGYAGLGYAPKLIDARLYSLIPDNDRRKQLFNGPSGDKSALTTGARYPYAARKFGNIGDWTMDYIYMRTAEMVLIQAEALARKGEYEQAADVLRPMMNKYFDGGWDVQRVSVEDVMLQRRIELWGEGFSFFDLKRTNKGIDRAYDGNNHLENYQLQVPAHDVRWTYQIPLSAFDSSDENFDLDHETDQNP